MLRIVSREAIVAEGPLLTHWPVVKELMANGHTVAQGDTVHQLVVTPRRGYAREAVEDDLKKLIARVEALAPTQPINASPSNT